MKKNMKKLFLISALSWFAASASFANGYSRCDAAGGKFSFAFHVNSHDLIYSFCKMKKSEPFVVLVSKGTNADRVFQRFEALWRPRQKRAEVEVDQFVLLPQNRLKFPLEEIQIVNVLIPIDHRERARVTLRTFGFQTEPMRIEEDGKS